MRVKTVDNTPRILLNMDEAYKIKEALEDYETVCTMHAYEETSEDVYEIINKLDEAILKAESL